MLEPEPLAEHRLEPAAQRRGSRRPARRARAPRRTGKPLVSVQTCRSCTSRRPATATIARADRVRVDVAGRRLEEDARRLADQPVRAPRTSARRRADRRSGRTRSQPVSSTISARDRSADEREQVGGDVQERTADVQAVAARPRQQRGRDEVDGDPPRARRRARCRRGRRPAKPAGGSRRRRSRCPRARASGRSPAQRGSRAGGIRTSSAPAPGAPPSVAATTAKPSARDVRDQVSRVGEQSERAGEDAGDDLADHQRRDQRQSGEQELPIALHAVVVVVRVHSRQANSTAQNDASTLAQMSTADEAAARPVLARPRSNRALSDQWRGVAPAATFVAVARRPPPSSGCGSAGPGVRLGPRVTAALAVFASAA